MQTTDYNRGTKLTVKGLIIGGLMLFLLIPTIFIANIVEERKARQLSVQEEISQKWAGEQTIVGPILVIPYHDEKNDVRYHYVLPDNLDIKGKILPEPRKRDIFKVMVYQSNLTMSGQFAANNLLPEGVSLDKMIGNKAYVYLGISDFAKGLEKQPALKWNGSETTIDEKLIENSVLNNGLCATVDMGTFSADYTFEIKLNLRGSSGLYFAPTGKTTTAQLTSEWKHPSFDGNYLPTKSEEDDKGFVANWDILTLHRSADTWKANNGNELEETFGVKLYQPNNTYTKTDRSIKYAILFIALTFALCFFIEILQKRSVHPIQYILVGLALCIFYTLLLSISEYIDFNYAYLIASVAIISLIVLYTQSIFGKWRIAALFGGVLVLLYGFILILIQLEDTALLIGSIGLFILLAVIMYYSRKIDWYGEGSANLK